MSRLETLELRLELAVQRMGSALGRAVLPGDRDSFVASALRYDEVRFWMESLVEQARAAAELARELADAYHKPLDGHKPIDGGALGGARVEGAADGEQETEESEAEEDPEEVASGYRKAPRRAPTPDPEEVSSGHRSRRHRGAGPRPGAARAQDSTARGTTELNNMY